ncbi:MAG: hypothetical protein QM778_30990 [Myxococcales bacterium]
MRSVSLLGAVALLLTGCRGLDPEGQGSSFAPCCGGQGTCVPDALTPADLSARLDRGECGEAMLCAPTLWVEDANAVPTACRSAAREGRCLPGCLPELAAQSDRLQQESCANGQLCAPCFNPLTGEDTQACRIAGDRPLEPGRPFSSCCEDHGRCVPEQSLLARLSHEDRARLGDEGCESEEGTLCVPEPWLDASTSNAAVCRAKGNLEGRCLPSCLPEVAAQSSRLGQQGCKPDQLCVPCFDPISGADTQACRIAGDAPSEPAQRFERCCGSQGAELGTCLPVELLRADQVSQLPVDRCTRPGTRCVPSEFVEERSVARCSFPWLFGASVEGLCLPECFLPVTTRFFTPRGGCGTARRCAPCASLSSTALACE